MAGKTAPIQVHERFLQIRLVVHIRETPNLAYGLVLDRVDGRNRRSYRVGRGTVTRPPGEPSAQLAIDALALALADIISKEPRRSGP